MTYIQAVEAAREALIRSVRIRLRSDVPLAFCMSGGVDSNSLISIAKNICGYDVHGFTIVNKDLRYEEQKMINYSVKELGIRHTAIPLDPNGFLPKLRELVRYHDAPVYTITYYTHWLLMQSIHQKGYKISLSGTAADELFSGYYDHHLQYLAMVQSDKPTFLKKKADWEKHIRPIVRNRYLQDPEAFIKNPNLRSHIFMDVDDFRSYLTSDWMEAFAEDHFSDDLMRNRMLNEIFHETVPCLLHEDDLNAMYYSIENRSPFLDRGLFETAFSIPTRHLVQDGMAKAVLRDAMKGIAPEKILTNRRKVGFNAPIFDLLDVKNPVVKKELLWDSPIWKYIKREKIEAILARDSVSENESKFLFFFISSKMFLEELCA
jgi:asparagine synthase (glutamine-hydrolysing)